MPSLTFLGIENPLGVLGPKVKGVITDAAHLKPIAHVSKSTADAAKYASQSTTNKFVNRAARLPAEVNTMMVDDTIDNRDYVLGLLKARRHHPFRTSHVTIQQSSGHCSRHSSWSRQHLMKAGAEERLAQQITSNARTSN